MNQPSANGTTIRALSTKTVFVRCWDTPTDSDSRNFTKQTREVTGKGDSLEENTNMLCKKYKQGFSTCLVDLVKICICEYLPESKVANYIFILTLQATSTRVSAYLQLAMEQLRQLNLLWQSSLVFASRASERWSRCLIFPTLTAVQPEVIRQVKNSRAQNTEISSC